MEIFSKIRAARKSKRLTLKEVSKKSKISVNYLSQIERGRSNPTVGTIKKITDALSMRVMEFVEGKDSFENEKVQIVRRHERKTLTYPKSKLRISKNQENKKKNSKINI